MSEGSVTPFVGYVQAIVAVILLLLIVPAASASSRQIKPGWRAAIWPFIFAGFGLTSLSGALASGNPSVTSETWLWKAFHLLAGFSFTLLTVESVYRAVSSVRLLRIVPVIWAFFIAFIASVLLAPSFIPVLVYSTACGVVVFLTYSTLYARDRDRASDALSIMIGTGIILFADLVASLAFEVNLGFASFSQVLPYNLLVIIALIFLYRGASASYNVKYDLYRSRERTLAQINYDQVGSVD